MLTVERENAVSNAHAITRRELGAGAICTWVASLAGAAEERKSAATPRSASPARWREDFPALSQRVNGQPLAYLASAMAAWLGGPTLLSDVALSITLLALGPFCALDCCLAIFKFFRFPTKTPRRIRLQGTTAIPFMKRE